MQVISVAFRVAMFGFLKLGVELLGTPGRAVWWNSTGFFQEFEWNSPVF
jgi:hypothetical protein